MQQPDLFLPYPGTRILASGPEALLIKEFDGTLGIIDRTRYQIYRLKPLSFSIGFQMLGSPINGMGLFRGGLPEALGFWLGRGATYVGLLNDGIMPECELLCTTRILASPGQLQHRRTPHEPWKKLIWHIEPK